SGIAVDCGGKQLTERVTHGPALDARDAISGAHRAAVVEKQSFAQLDAPCQLIVGDRVAFGHLRAGKAVRADRIERVEYVVTMIAGYGCRGEHWVQQRKVCLRHEP